MEGKWSRAANLWQGVVPCRAHHGQEAAGMLSGSSTLLGAASTLHQARAGSNSVPCMSSAAGCPSFLGEHMPSGSELFTLV